MELCHYLKEKHFLQMDKKSISDRVADDLAGHYSCSTLIMGNKGLVKSNMKELMGWYDPEFQNTGNTVDFIMIWRAMRKFCAENWK